MDQILIVGASRGIGAELARSLRGEARLWGVSREPGSDGFEATRPWDAASQDFPADFLLSREARWITGQVLHVDGGLGAVRRFK